jgi:hypothetical protein
VTASLALRALRIPRARPGGTHCAPCCSRFPSFVHEPGSTRAPRVAVRGQKARPLDQPGRAVWERTHML